MESAIEMLARQLTVRSALAARGSSALAVRAPAETIEVTIAEAEKMTAAALVRITPR